MRTARPLPVGFQRQGRPPRLLPHAPVLLLCLAACRGREAGRTGEGEPATSLPSVLSGDGTGLDAHDATPPGRPVVEVAPGPYADDPRFAVLAAELAERVRAAADRLELTTGLGFRDRAPPRVVLGALRSETQPHALETEVGGGRRRARLEINARALLTGRTSIDRALLRGLCEAALLPPPSLAASAARLPPPWFLVFAGHFAAGDAADEVERWAREGVHGGVAPRVDPSDPAHARGTGLAVALLLAERSTPEQARRVLALAADGDDPDRLVRRALGDPTAPFAGEGRALLEDALSRVELEGERLVARVRDALLTLGPGGFHAALADVDRDALPVRVRAELDALALRAALRTGDVEAGRAVLARAPCEPSFLALLDDPARHLLEAARLLAYDAPAPGAAPASSAVPSGAEALSADALLSRLFLDFPAHPARDEAVEELERLLPRLSLERQGVALAQVLAERGPALVSTRVFVDYVDALLLDHRPGAARRFLRSLGDRAHDEAFADLLARADEAEAEPSHVSTDVNRARVAAWVDRPGPATTSDVRDGGAVAAVALADRLPPSPGPERRAAVALMLDVAGGARAVALLAPEWSGAVERLAPDLEVLAASMGYGDLARTVEALYPAVRTDARAAAEWERVCLGIDPVRLASDETLLSRLYSPDFSTRREAFEEVSTGSAPVRTPLLLHHFVRDPAVLMRRVAVRTAAEAGLTPLVVEALADPSYVVRQTACAALAASDVPEAPEALLDVLRRPDPDERVLGAAAAGLVRLAAQRPRLVRAVTSIVRVAEPALAEGVAARLPDLDAAAVAAGLTEQLRAEAVGPTARRDRAVLFRLFSALARATGRPSGYDPSLTHAEVERLVLALPALAAAPRR